MALVERAKTKPDAIFIYYVGLHNLAWPQVIRDMEMFEYQVEHNKIPVLQRHGITEAEAALGINELMKLYPCVRHTDDNGNW